MLLGDSVHLLHSELVGQALDHAMFFREFKIRCLSPEI